MSQYNGAKLANLSPPGTPRLSPHGVADFIEKLRYAAPLPHGATGTPVSRAQQLINYLDPALKATRGAYDDVVAVQKAIDYGLPGSGKYLARKARRGAHHLGDYIGGHIDEQVAKHGPGAIAAGKAGLDRLRDTIFGPKPTAWYEVPVTAAGVGLGGAGLLGLGGFAANEALKKMKGKEETAPLPQMAMPESAPSMEDTSLDKISSALELIADEIDAFGTAAFVEEKVASEEPANVFGQFYEFYKRQVGEEPPAALVEKLAQDADEETLSALEKLVKRAGMERPTPLGEPSEGGGYRAPPSSRDDAMKTAWEQFEETLLNYESA
jgi:hypothetical protein